jgi:HK97 family phage major capsid protein
MSKRLQELLTTIGEKSNEVNGLFDKAGNEDPSAEFVKQVKDLNKEIEDLEHQAKDLMEAEGIRDRNQKRLDDLRRPQNPGLPFAGGENNPAASEKSAPERKTLGQTFVNDEAIQSWLKQVAPSGHVNEKARLQSPPVQMNALMKALVTGVSDTSAGALVRTDYAPLVAYPFRELTVRDLVTMGTTGTDLIEYPRVTGYTNNAAPVAEATDVNTGAKPESDMALEKVTTAVKTIAHWIPATKRSLADAGQVRTLIDNFLRYGLEEELEDQIINGNGTGENFTGILNTTGTQTQAYDTSLLTTTRKARTLVKVTGRARPTAYVFHPNDWEDFDLLQDGENRYYFGGPSVLGNPRLWGVPVVETEAATEGVGILGDWRQIVIWDREQASITVSDSHADFFIRNLVAILAEMRAAMGVLRPAAFVEIDLTA